MVSNNGFEQGRDPMIFSIQHFCLQDGPGIRSIVFFKGCPLRCVWCQNPESWNPNPELAFKPHLCIGCKTCVKVCPEKAITDVGMRDRNRCRLCFTCAENCPSGALTRIGAPPRTEAIVEELRSEFPFYQASDGGVTFSGGEPTLYVGFAAKLAAQLRKEGIHIALETCGKFSLEGKVPKYRFPAESLHSSKDLQATDLAGPVWQLLSTVDLVLFDVKVFDEAEHRRFCGTSNSRIKWNLRALAALARQGSGPALSPRLPLIPGITDSSENLRGWAQFLNEIGLSRLTLVPYHNMGEPKRLWLSMEPGPDIKPLTEEALEKARQELVALGISCYEPGEEDWPAVQEHRKMATTA